MYRVNSIHSLGKVIDRVTLDSYPDEVTVTVHFPDELAGRLAAAAARRGVGVDEIAAELVTAGLAETEPPTSSATPQGRRLGFAGVGASSSGRSASEADDMLAEGFGHD